MEAAATTELRSKKLQLDGIVASRKRKLREFYAVCENGYQLPQYSVSANPSPIDPDERRFLEISDILQGRYFDESNLPRRQLRSNTSKQRSPIRKPSPDTRPNDAARKAAKLQRDGSSSRKSRAPTPTSRPESVAGASQNGGDGSPMQGISMQRSSSKGSQTDLPADSSNVLSQIVQETFDNATRPRPSMPNAVVPPQDLESDKIRSRLESRPNSPGVDPRQAMPISPEDAANLNAPLVQGLGSHDGPHPAKTVHLPPQEEQEQRLRDAKSAREQKEGRKGPLSIHLPPRDGTREVLSSPGSTNDAQSAATPAMHDASTDTSPENDNGRYDAEQTDGKVDYIPTPPELRHTPEEIAAKAAHDRHQQGQIDAATAAILGSSPTAPSNQLLEEQAAVDEAGDLRMSTNGSQDGGDRLTKDTDAMVPDDIEDQTQAARVSSSMNPGLEAGPSQDKPGEIADSEAEDTPPVDHMDIDTPVPRESTVNRLHASTGPTLQPQPESSRTAATSAPPSRRTPASAVAPVLERMTTRVGSGAMRPKSVSEILGDTPRPGPNRSDSDSPRNSSSPSRSTTPQSPSTRVRSLVEKAKEKERSKLSTVIFPSRPAAQDPARISNGVSEPKDDYFLPLFVTTTAAEKRGAASLENLLATAHKTITTSNAYVPLHENQTAKVLRRIYNLQCSNKWSLRQHKRSPEAIRPTTHWDVLLQEAKWMRTDFREERKWKMAVARNLANACAEWHEANAEDRKLLQVKAKIPSKPDPNASKLSADELSKDTEMSEASSQIGAHSTPDLVASGGSDSPMDDLDEEPRFSLTETVAPTAIFGLQDDDVVFGLRRSPTTDKLLSELPMYGAPLAVPQSDLPTSDIDPDRFWRRPALPLSKFVEGRMELRTEPPPRKKSRYEYDTEDDDDDHVVFGEARVKPEHLPPENTDVALFDAAHKATRERIHNSHQFKPPSEYTMPPLSFFENRNMSQWTWDEDNELKGYVREYSYNWGLISSMLTSKSLFSSGAERRTPWECFERWVQVEGMPADMGRTHYFRMYTSRIDQANRNVLAQTLPPQNNANGQVQPAPRRRPTNSIRVDRRRQNKHLTIVNAMMKLAKKKETQLQKQQHAAGMAAMRKANENPGPHNRQLVATTPQDFSRIKAEREEAFKERVVALQHRQEQQRRMAELQRRNPQNPPQAGLPNGVPPRPPTGSAMAANGTPASSQNLTVPGQNRPRPMPPQMPGQLMPNGARAPPMPMNGLPPQIMQGQLPLPPPNPALDIGLVTRAQQISQQQQQLRLQQQGHSQSPQMHNSPPRMNGLPQPGFPMQNNMMPPFNSNINGVGTPPAHTNSPSQGQASSPRMGQNLMNGVPNISSLEQHYKQQYPTATPDQITTLIRNHLAKNVNQQQRQGLAQSAMNAAAGSPQTALAAMNALGGGQNPTPQMYAAMLRQQQEAQQKNAQQLQHQAANIVGNGTAPSMVSGNTGQGHAHRASSVSVNSGK